MRILVQLSTVPCALAFLSTSVLRNAHSPGTKLHSFPHYVPADVSEIQEPAALDIVRHMRRISVGVPDFVSSTPVATNFVKTDSSDDRSGGPILFLHGFDSSVLEFRRLLPELARYRAEAYAVDILGWGFTETKKVASFGAEAKRMHLLQFWKQIMGGRPMTLVGASLGGAIALDFAYEFPEAVKRLVLIDAQGYIDGSGPGASLPGPLARLGISILGSKPLRSLANQMSYTDKKLATDDAVRVGRLHVLCDGWAAASLEYMGSGGFSVSSKVPKIATETLVLWGRQDKILDPELYAQRFVDEMPNARLTWVEDCGHVPHLEQPEKTASAIMAFVGSQDAFEDTCVVCGGSELQPCPNCDGQGSYKSYSQLVVCKTCKGSGNVLCRKCFKGDPWDLQGARARVEERRNDSLLGFRRRPGGY